MSSLTPQSKSIYVDRVQIVEREVALFERKNTRTYNLGCIRATRELSAKAEWENSQFSGLGGNRGCVLNIRLIGLDLFRHLPWSRCRGELLRTIRNSSIHQHLDCRRSGWAAANLCGSLRQCWSIRHSHGG